MDAEAVAAGADVIERRIKCCAIVEESAIICCWTNDGVSCGKAAEIKYNIPLCAEHKTQLHFRRIKSVSSAFAKYYEEVPRAPHSPGHTYIVQIPNGRWKIGYSTNLLSRFRGLHKSLGPLNVIAVLDGGFTLEQVLHFRFDNIRVQENGEQFEPNDDLRLYAATHGVCDSALKIVDQYCQYSRRYQDRVKSGHRSKCYQRARERDLEPKPEPRLV